MTIVLPWRFLGSYPRLYPSLSQNSGSSPLQPVLSLTAGWSRMNITPPIGQPPRKVQIGRGAVMAEIARGDRAVRLDPSASAVSAKSMLHEAGRMV